MTQPAGPFIGYGADFMLSTDGGSTYLTVGHCIDVSAPDIKTGAADASYVQMPAPWHQKVAKLADGGQASFKLIWNPTSYGTLLAQIRIMRYWKLVFPDLGSTASTLVFQGFLASFGSPVPLEDLIVVDATVEVTGQPVFVAGT